MTDAELKDSLFDFLRGDAGSMMIPEIGECTREQAQARLRELIPTSIRVLDRCRWLVAIAVAAPHVRYDGWSEWFCRRTAKQFKLGRVVARHFRDQNEYDIPVAIGRHIHVNRPTESRNQHGREVKTARAAEAFRIYTSAIARAAGSALPIDLLLEFHAHRRHEFIEIAVQGIDEDLSAELLGIFNAQRRTLRSNAKLKIEPLHKLYFTARHSKRHGSMNGAIAKRALHIEIPLELRCGEHARHEGFGLLKPLFNHLLKSTGVDVE